VTLYSSAVTKKRPLLEQDISHINRRVMRMPNQARADQN